MVEDGLAAASRSGADGCIVLVDETSHADVRFALNTTTTALNTQNRSRVREIAIPNWISAKCAVTAASSPANNSWRDVDDRL